MEKTEICPIEMLEDAKGSDAGVPFICTDAGRCLSKRSRQKKDCTVRAFALALGDRALWLQAKGIVDSWLSTVVTRQAIPMPERIQLKRSKGWKMPENTVKVDRTTKWGNPFVPGKPVPLGPLKGQMVADKRHAFVLYRSFAPLSPALIAAARAELAGKNLACWCAKDDPYEDVCHAAVLLELANGH